MNRRRDDGYILLVVLVALVLLSLLASAVAVVTDRALLQAQADADGLAAELGQFSTRETLMFLLATQRQTVAGLTVDDQIVMSYGNAQWTPDPDEASVLPPPLPVGNEIRLDARPYRGLDGQHFAFQDDAGLFALNWTPDPIRDGFFAAAGIPPGERAGLEAKRLDYQDPGSAYRVGGAEAARYRELGLPPPSNDTMHSPMELRRMAGWREALADWDDATLLARTSAQRNIFLNINTAPAFVLASLPGANEGVVERLLAQREALPFLLRWEFLQAYPLALHDESPINFQASGSGNLYLWDNARGPVRLLHWTLTPVDEGGRPWRIDYEVLLPREQAIPPSPSRTPASPLLSEQGPAG